MIGDSWAVLGSTIVSLAVVCMRRTDDPPQGSPAAGVTDDPDPPTSGSEGASTDTAGRAKESTTLTRLSQGVARAAKPTPHPSL